MIFDTIMEEAAGTLCGIPPGTITAAKAAGLAIGAASTSSKAQSTAKRNTSGMNEKERRAVAAAVGNLATTAKHDNPHWGDDKCLAFGMKLLALARKIYDDEIFKRAFLDALSRDPGRHRRLIKNIGRRLR
jgi:hypothetical protein